MVVYVMVMLRSKFKLGRARDASGETSLHYAAARSTPDLARLLLKHGADVNSVDAMDQTPLHFAAIWSGQTKTPQFLIGNGALLNMEDKDGDSPFANRIDSYLSPGALTAPWPDAASLTCDGATN